MGKQSKLKKQRRLEKSIYYKDEKAYVSLQGKDADDYLKSFVNRYSEDDFDEQGNLISRN